MTAPRAAVALAFAALLVRAAAQTRVPGGGAVGTPTAAAADRQAFQRYLAELNGLLAAPKAPGPLTMSVQTGSSRLGAPSSCSLFGPDAARTPTDECMRCHGLHQTHPVDFEYAPAAARRPEALRPAEEAVRRGVFLPEGQVKCVTCHDAQSPWKYRIALPPGAAAHPAVDLSSPRTYETPRKIIEAQPPPPRGAAVTPTPLCRSCHTYGD